MEACRLVFEAPAFKLRVRDAQLEGHADWLDMLALASKHSYAALFTKCLDFLEAQVGWAEGVAGGR